MSLLMQGTQAPVPVEPNVFAYANEQVIIAGQSSPATSLLHYATDIQPVLLQADIMGTDNNGPFVVAINLPRSVGLPLVRFANGAPTQEEVYLDTTIVNGHMAASGTLPSGAWKLLPDRVNRALAEINAPFRLELPVVTFIITRGA